MKTTAWSGTVLTTVCMTVAGGATQAQSPPAAESDSAIVFSSPEKGNLFQAYGSASQAMRRMQEIFDDPQARANFRAEQQAQLLKSHQDLGSSLGIDAAIEARLIELLTDQQMDKLEAFYRRTDDGAAAKAQGPSVVSHLLTHADRETRQVQALRDLLGQEGLERYQRFREFVRERIQVGDFDAHLEPAHRLRADQKASLLALYREINDRELDQLRLNRDTLYPRGPATGGRVPQDEIRRLSELHAISSGELNWRRSLAAGQLLRERAAGFLTEAQLATLVQINADKARNLQLSVENARAQAGLSREIPEQQPESSTPQPAPVAGKVRLSLKLTVNRNEPIFLTQVMNSGEPITFATAEGLIVEARPTLYDDQRFDLLLAYYEDGVTGRRLIGRVSQMGTSTSASYESATAAYAGSSSTVIAGNKGYAAEVRARVEPI